MKPALKAISFIFIFCALSSCARYENPSPDVLWDDYKARKAIKNEKYEDALGLYYKVLESDVDRYATHSNIGVLLNMIQKPEDALKSLQHALKLAEDRKDLAAVFSVRFNLGTYYGKLKKVTEALENYQAALDIVPTSIETKTNIELLIQQQQQDQQQEQQKKQGEGEGKSGKNEENKDGKSGQSDDKKDDKGDNKQDKDKDQDQKGDEKENEKPQEEQKRESSSKYKPRPYQGDQLSEGDVKKILGELRNQEQKIRANFDKKEKGKESNNGKDW